MELLTRDFAVIVNTLRGVAPSAAGHEKRQTPRIEVQARVTIWPLVNGLRGEPVVALTRDISFRGIGLLLSTPLPTECHYVIALPRGEADSVLVLCQSTVCREIADGIYAVGGQFMKHLTRERPAPGAPPAAAVA